MYAVLQTIIKIIVCVKQGYHRYKHSSHLDMIQRSLLMTYLSKSLDLACPL